MSHDVEVLEIEAHQMRVGDFLLRERFRSTSGLIRRYATSMPGDRSVGFFIEYGEGPRWFDPEEIVTVRRSASPTP